MFANIALKRVVDFHGHVCPELALGSKFCDFVQHFLDEKVLKGNGFSVLAENSTAALDAIQILLGVTVGNQRLMVMDYGKHNYTLYSRHQDQGWSFRMIALSFGDEEAFHVLEGKIMNDNALLEDIVSFQQLIDARVRRIFTLSPAEIFAIEPAQCVQPPRESTSLYTRCSLCGEHVLPLAVLSAVTRYCVSPVFKRKLRDVPITACNNDSIHHVLNITYQ